MRKTSPLLVLAAVLLSAAPLARAADVMVAPDNPNIVYMGRFTKDHRFGWTGSAIRLRFTGTAVAADLAVFEGDAAAMQIVVDRVPTRPVFLRKGGHRYRLASDLTPGTHTVELFERTEAAHHGEVKFGGFLLSPGAKVQKLSPKNRRILVIGDSITCGYKNEARDPKHYDALREENGYMSYAAIAARRVQAQIMMICWSGRGLYRNFYFNHDREGTLPRLFDRTLPLDAMPEWDQHQYVPQLIIINLGTNDLDTDNGRKAALTKKEFLAAYDQFLDRLHRLFPDARVIVSIGPIYDEPIAGWIRTLPSKYAFVHSLVFSDKNPPEDRGAGTLHPSVLGDIKMADELTPVIRTIMHWERRRDG